MWKIKSRKNEEIGKEDKVFMKWKKISQEKKKIWRDS